MAYYEGIIIQKSLHRERNLVCQTLLRSGKMRTFYLYGGRGGGKRAKGSVAELGHLIGLETGTSKSSPGHQDILSVKEYKLKWSSNYLRTNYQAFYLVCLCFEIIKKVTIEQRDEDEGNQFSGFFNITSNFLYYSDQALEKNKFVLASFFFNFLVKILNELGTLPNLQDCAYCETKLNKENIVKFDVQAGNFSCYQCLSRRDETLSDNKDFFEFLTLNSEVLKNMNKYLRLRTKDFEEFSLVNVDHCQLLLSYLCYQYGISIGDFKSWDMVKSF